MSTEKPDISRKRSIDLAGLKISPEAFGELTLFYNTADGFETLSEVVDRAVRNWLAQQGAAIRMKQIDMQFMADASAEEDARSAGIERRVKKAKRESRSLPANVVRIDACIDFCPQ